MSAVPTRGVDSAEVAYRLAAWGVDQCLSGATLLVGTVFGVVVGFRPSPYSLSPLEPMAVGLGIGLLAGLGACLSLWMFQWWLTATDGTTLGKRLFGLRIVREDGEPVGFVDGVVLRSWVSGLLLLPTLGTFLLLDALPIFSPARRCVHDRIAKTMVVLDPRGVDAEDSYPIAVRRGLVFARMLSVAVLSVAFGGGVLVAADLALGWSHGGLATVIPAGLAIGLVAAAPAVYDEQHTGMLAATILTAALALFSSAWAAHLFTQGSPPVLAWLLTGTSGMLSVLLALFVEPSERLGEAKYQIDIQAMDSLFGQQ